MRGERARRAWGRDDAATTVDACVAHAAEVGGLLDRGVVWVGSDRLEEVGAELEEAAELVVLLVGRSVESSPEEKGATHGIQRGEREGRGAGGDEAKVGAEETFVGELGEEDQGVEVDLRKATR